MSEKEHLEFIEFDNPEEYLDTAKELSEYIESLSLTNEQNDKLIDLMLKHNRVARREAFRQGIEFMLDAASIKSVEDENSTEKNITRIN